MSAATGGTVTNFSPRFSLTGMTGVFPPTVVTGLQSVSGTKGPETINQVSSPQVGANPAVAGGPAQYNVPYTMQTAQVRYAPMPPMAPSKITAKNRNPAWPTSAYTVYETYAGAPNAITTETLIQTFSVVSREATVCFLAFHVRYILTLTDGRPIPTCHGQVPESLERLNRKDMPCWSYESMMSMYSISGAVDCFSNMT